MKFEVGAIVQLKSGGPKMTVESMTEEVIVCVWSDGKKTVREGFVPATIVASDRLEKILEAIKKAEEAAPEIKVQFVGTNKTKNE